MTRLFRLAGICGGLLFIFILNLNAALRGKPDWIPSAKVSSWLSTMSMADTLSQELEPPSLFPEKPFTKGYQDTLFWSTDSVRSKLPAGMNLLFFEIRATYIFNPETIQPDTVRRWGFVEAGVDSAVFDNLPESVPIVYTLRYYALRGADEYELSLWSEPETSIQDAHVPILDTTATHIIGLQHSSTGNWVKGAVCSLYVAASDPNGIVQMVRIQEDGGPIIDDNNFENKDSIIYRTIIPLRYPSRTPFTLLLSVFDAAGQESNKLAFDLSIWPEEDQNRMMVFPNPYNPNSGKASIFLPGVNEAFIYDLFGHRVLALKKDVAADFFIWDGRNESGAPVADGGYIIVASGSKTSCKIAVVR